MKNIILILVITILTQGCATIIKGTNDKIAINSIEKDTLIYVDGAVIGKDAVLIQVERGDTHTIRATKQGCQDIFLNTGESFDATSLLGILIDFGIITIPIDLLSGAAWKTDPKVYSASPICNSQAGLNTARPSDEVQRKLEQLEQFKKDGLITTQEYKKKRAELIADM